MKNSSILFIVFATTFLLLACDEKTDTNTVSHLQDSLANVRISPPPPMREAESPGVNIAPLATAWAQSTFPSYSPDRINDGDNSTWTDPNFSWANAYSYGPDGYLPQWVDLRFDSAVSFTFLRLYTSHGYEMRDWIILALNSASQWDTLNVVRNNLSTMRYFSYSQPVTTTTVRVLCEKGPTHQMGYARINELELYYNE